MVLTRDASTADYTLEVMQIPAHGKICVDLANSNSACPESECSATLFSAKGDVLFQTKTHSYPVMSLSSVMRDVCKAMGQ